MSAMYLKGGFLYAERDKTAGPYKERKYNAFIRHPVARMRLLWDLPALQQIASGNTEFLANGTELWYATK